MMMREHEISDVTPEDETTSMYQCRCRAADPDSDADDHWKNVRRYRRGGRHCEFNNSQATGESFEGRCDGESERVCLKKLML